MTTHAPLDAQLQTRYGVYPLHLRCATGFFSRLRGLMFTRRLAEGAGLLITCCTGVHTCFMRYTLDLVYLGQDGEVTHCVPHLKPWRLSTGTGRGLRGRRTRHVLELPAGSIARLGIRPRDRLQHPLLGGSAT